MLRLGGWLHQVLGVHVCIGRAYVVNYKRLRHDDAILVMHRYVVAGVSVGELMADVVFTHGSRQGSGGQKQQRPSLRMAVAHYSLTELMHPYECAHRSWWLTSATGWIHGVVREALPHSP